MLALGHTHGLAFTDGEQVVAWGDNHKGQLGDGTRVAREVPGIAFAASLCYLSAGANHYLGLTEAGGVLAWGNNDFGKLGDGTTLGRLSAVAVLSGTCVRTLSAGWYHSLAVTESGELLAWGHNKLGQLGDGSKETRLAPVRILAAGARSVAAGWRHSLAVTESGSVLGWGANDALQLGDAVDPTGCLRPTELPGLAGIKQVAAGFAHNLALTQSGEVLAWGANDHGQLGDGTTGQRGRPVSVLKGVRAVAAGYNHSVALTDTGEVLTWGANALGQLGDGSTLDRAHPFKVLYQADICGIAAGWNHNAAWTSEVGESWGWGQNDHNQVGVGKKGENAMWPEPILRDFRLKVHPSYFGITLQQLNELDDKARSHFGARYRGASTRDLVDEIICPATSKLVNRGYARVVNEGALLPAEAFVSHCWDEDWQAFIESVNQVFGTLAKPPTLWICFTALSQSGPIRFAKRPGLQPDEGPFVEALRRARIFLLVRNKRVDVYSRLWCVQELHWASALGFRAEPGRFYVHGPNSGTESKKEVNVLSCQTSEPEDKEWLLTEILRKEGLLEDIGRVATEVRRLYYR